MAPRKRVQKPRADAPSNEKKTRDIRAQRREAVREQILREKVPPNEVPREDVPQGQARRDKITSLNALNSPLLRLPAEIGNVIFLCVFTGMEYTFDEYCWEDPETQCLYSFDECNLGLIAASRQLHAETGLLPYKLGFFNFLFRVSKGKWSYCVERFMENRTREQELVMDDKNMAVCQLGKQEGGDRYYHGASAWDNPYLVRGT
ncbi:hypothetical protein J4E86_007971 [Alternaria arbusti]|uniref:uncharacterized protein n=1 Tax=Alternaria arbusti TaxID=232088 RepID=UPI002220022C|nr:uncharacterized protein J4E86_007971 [Alternaria arbusti]KAI4948623.1 hypothetical protein J4E86_007971 [Alternaria arbusti]